MPRRTKAKALGADHVINYKTDRFEGVVRKLTAKKGVDVVFEHVGGETFNASLLCLKRGGRLVTCGSTAGPTVTINLMQLFQQQYKIFGSFGASMRNIRDSLSKMADGHVADHRHRGRTRRFRTRPRADRKPSGLRKSGRAFLMPSSSRRMIRRTRRGAKRAGDAVVGALAVGLLKGLRRVDPDRMADFAAGCCAQSARCCRSNGSAAPISRPRSRRNPPPR